MYFRFMRATATEIVRHWSSYLLKVQQGMSIDVVKSGKTVARISPPLETMTGKRLASLLRKHQPDTATADEMDRLLNEQEEHSGPRVYRR
jgi:antitoxin (DNA-binding transcriptional repressor) of toxin-antitoxin stability system